MLSSDLIFGMYFSVYNFIQTQTTLKFPQVKKRSTNCVITLIKIISFFFFFLSMVLIESVKSVRVTLLAMTLWSSTMLFLFIMVSRQKKDSTLLRMKKITVTETFLERLKRNSSWSILSRPDNVKKNVYCQRKIWKGWLGLLVCVKRLAAVD